MTGPTLPSRSASSLRGVRVTATGIRATLQALWWKYAFHDD
jgi:hypothetical protein